MPLKMLFLFSCLLFSFLAHAQVEGRLMSQSPTGQTSVFNVGRLDHVFEGDEGIILKNIQPLEEKALRVVPVAKGRCIKSTSHGSIWILYQTFNSELLVPGDPFLLMTDTNLLNGQRDPVLGRTTLVAGKEDLSEKVKSYLKDDRDRLSKKKDDYESIEELKEFDSELSEDINLVDADEWKRDRNRRYRSSIYKSASKSKFKRSYRLEKFNQLVTDYLNRVNDANFSYDDFFEDQMRDAFSNEFRKKSHFNSEYENFLYEQSLKSGHEVKLYQSLLNKGEAWSEDFSDEELRLVLGNVSELNESERRVKVTSKPFKYSLFLEYGKLISDPQVENDSYKKEGLNSFGIDFEITPFLKHDELERFTLFFNPQMTNSALSVNKRNMNFDYTSASLGLQWYAMNPAYKINYPLFFIGIYTKFGYAQVESPDASDIAKYSLLSLPGLRLGTRFNFKNRFGLRIVGSMESLKLERYEVNSFNSILSERLDLVESKVTMALSYSF